MASLRNCFLINHPIWGRWKNDSFQTGLETSPALLFHTGRKPVPVSHWFLKGTGSLGFSWAAAQQECGIIMADGRESSCSPLKVCSSSKWTQGAATEPWKREEAILRDIFSFAPGLRQTGFNMSTSFFPVTLSTILSSILGFWLYWLSHSLPSVPPADLCQP